MTISGRAACRVGLGVVGLFAGWGAWTLSPGLPVGRGPVARPGVTAAGLRLFVHEWEPGDRLARGDGLGPVFNARSCVACHSVGGVGGGGGLRENVLAFEALPVAGRPSVATGMVHKAAVDRTDRETGRALQARFPAMNRGPNVSAFDPVRVESINSTSLFGAGWLDLVSDRAILYNARVRRLAQAAANVRGDFQGVPVGRPRILPDGRVGKFGWKAQFATLDEFVAAACANEIGLGNPLAPQAKPLGRPNAPDAPPDLDRDQFAALVSFVGTLPRPREDLPAEPGARARADRGKALFRQTGCAECHTPDVGGLAGVYSDFLLHRLDGRGGQGREGGGYGMRFVPPVPVPSEHPVAEEWRTPPLWGVADSAPYFHDGASDTLEAAVLRHEGDAFRVTERFRSLPESDQAALLTFLQTLKAPREALPAPTPVRDPARLALAR